MLTHIRPAVTLIALFTLLTGLALPVGISGLAGAVAPLQAGGSLVEKNGQVVGSALIGQGFTAPKYFWPRPSALMGTDPKDSSKQVATPYDASESGASNLGPTSAALLARIKADPALAPHGATPADAVTTSGSGLDPDISPQNAALQAPRVAAARHVPVEMVRDLIAAHTRSRLLGVFGAPAVNVLALNLALDAGK